MPDRHDQLEGYCRRLGHHVSFGYCRCVERGAPCRLILDCWWERFDVREFLAEHLDPEQLAALEHPTRPDKATTLVELIERARRAAESNPDADP